METQAAKDIIRNTFNHPFDEDRFRYFIRNIFNDFEDGQDSNWITGHIKDSFKDHIKKYKRFGKYTDKDENKLDIIIVHLRRETAIERARTMQRNFVADYLKTRGEKDAAIVAYFTDNPDDWRFSYVRMEYKQEIVESDKVKVKTELTPARRYSFLVGKNEPNHTAQQQLLPILKDDKNNPSLADLEKVFSVEAVTKQFYQDYRGLFEKLTKELDKILAKDNKIKTEFESKNIDTANFAKKLLGQIVFLYFVQKKGWLGVGKDEKGNFKAWGTGPKNFLRQLFDKKFVQYDNYFDKVLEPLFYEALATERPRDYYSHLNCKIPFLNGGLFEPIGDYNWQETDIHISNQIMAEIFEVFDRYNFTVREDEPLEKEVAVDPEMLGQVFENLLPENLRKGQGAYYTPREIVHYMCQESLINYLDATINTGEVALAHSKPKQEKLFGRPDPEQITLKSTGYKQIVPRKDIEDFVRKGEFAVEHDQVMIQKTSENSNYKGDYKKGRISASIQKHAERLDNALATIKVCDPAVGSGAFLVGMMHEIVKARNVLTTYLKFLLEGGVPTKPGRAMSEERTIYNFKRHCIQESLYGVDIDPGAIEIAKLRLWLSLVVDEDDYHTIKPLPNLDYKIMQGNSLIEEFHSISLDLEKKNAKEELFSEESEVDCLIADLHDKQNALFNAVHKSDKDHMKQEVENAIMEIFHLALTRQKADYFNELNKIEAQSRQLPNHEDRQKYYATAKAKLDKKYDFDFEAVENNLQEMTHGNKVRNFFPWRLYFADVFRNRGGFDVVIANPPYVSHDKIIEKELFKYRFEVYEPYADLYCYFIEMAVSLQNKIGLLCFITSNSYLKANYGLPLRTLLNKKDNILQIINIEDFQVFDSAIVNSAILISQNKTLNGKPNCKIVNSSFAGNVPFAAYIGTYKHYYSQIDFNSKSWSLVEVKYLGIKNKIDKSGPSLERLKTKIRLGLATGANDAFIINAQKRQEFINRNRHNDKIIKPVLRGRDIFRYFYRDSGLYILLTKNTINVKNEYPDIYTYLGSFGNKFKARGAQGKHWSNLRACSFFDDFKKDKVIWIELSDKGRFAFCPNEIYLLNSAYFLLPPKILNTKYLLGILNSNLAQFYINIIAGTSGMGTLRWINVYVKEFPIPVRKLNRQRSIMSIVEKILSSKKSNPQADTSALEAEIDRLVYELYGLTKEEIKIVEESVVR